MDRETDGLTEEILSLALEIVHIIFEEDYVIVKKSGGHISFNSRSQSPDDFSCSSQKHAKKNDKILELTSQIFELLTGEDLESSRGGVNQDDDADFVIRHNYGKRHKREESSGSSPQGLAADRSEPTALYYPVCLQNDRGVITVRPQEVPSALYQDGSEQNPNSTPHKSGDLPEIYIHVPTEQTEYISIINDGGKTSDDQGHVMAANIPKPAGHTPNALQGKETSMSREEGKSTDPEQNFTEYTAFKIKEEPVEWEESNLRMSEPQEQEHLPAEENPPSYKEGNMGADLAPYQYTLSCIKREPAMFEEGTEISNHQEPTQTGFVETHFKEEPLTSPTENLTGMDSNGEQAQYMSTRIKEETLFDGDVMVYRDGQHLGTINGELSPHPSFQQTHLEEISYEYYSTHTGYEQPQPDASDKPFSCSECGKCFKYNSLLMHHSKSHQKKPMVCFDCGKQYSCKTEFDIHQRIHTGEKPFVCCECGKGFRRKSHMLRHQRIHGDKETFLCLECGKCFHRLDVLNQHRKIHKADVVTGPDVDIPMEYAQVLNTSIVYEHKDMFVCPECGNCYAEKEQLERHQRSHTGDRPFSCTECGKSFRFEALLELHWGSHIAAVSCPECGKAFASQSLLSHHLKIHARANEFICSECGKEFPSRSQLVDHYRTHTGEKPYMCPDCGKYFRRKAHVIRHRKIHAGNKPFSCIECGKCFESREILDRHAKMHRRKRPYRCNQCEKSYTKKSHLSRHQRTHAREKPYTCSECGESFTYATLLSQHQKTHNEKTSHDCSECGKSCNSDLALTKHRKIHSKEKAFVCAECGKHFTFYSHFMRHQTTHTGEKPYQCSECGKRFTRDSHLARHRRLHNRH